MGQRRRLILTAAAMSIASSVYAPAQSPAQALAQTTPTPAVAPATTSDAAPATMPSTTQVLDPIAVLHSTTATPAERDEAARRLVLLQTDTSRQALKDALLDIANKPGQLAAARALEADPHPDRMYVVPLFALIGKPNLTEAAISALAVHQDDPSVVKRLIDLAVDADHQQTPETRKAAIKAVATMSNKAAAQALLGLLSSDAERPEIRSAAATGLAEMTGGTAGQDVAQWRAWWNEKKNLSDAEFEHDLLASRAARLTLLEEHYERVVNEAQRMLTEAYQATSGPAREALLLRYLKANEPETRLVGVELIQQDFKNNSAIPVAAREQLRAMVGDSSPKVRVAVARALTYLNDPGAIAAVLAQLKQEPDADIRAELATALALTNNVQVVEPLLGLLADPSIHVAEVAADGLRELGPVIDKDPDLSARVANELRRTFSSHGAAPGNAPFRAALVDAMGMLHNPELSNLYPRLLAPSEAVAVRCAALRALGRTRQSWAADIIANSLDDPDEEVRLEAVNALDTTANFNQAEKLYNILKSPAEKPNIRQRAWEVLKNRFSDPGVPIEALNFWAERFRDEPERRIVILEALAARLEAAKNEAELATVRQNIGEEKMALADAAARANDPQTAVARAEEADKLFDQALQYYYTKNSSDKDMVTSALLARRMDALFASKQYSAATQFATASIARNSSNEDSLGRKLSNEIDRLRTARQYGDAVQLINAVNQMKPPLADQFLNRIRTIEADVHQKMATGQNPQSAS